MPSETQQLILQMRADLDQYNRSILNAQKKTEKFQKSTSDGLSRIEKNTKSAGDSLFKFSNVAKSVFAALSVGVLTSFADEVQLADNQLQNVTASTEQLVLVQMELNRIAIETRQNVNDLTSVYARFTRAGQEAGFTQQEVLNLTEALTKAFKIEGNTTAEVNSTLLQLTQSFRSGRIQGEEFRAVSESSTLVLQALAKQLNVTVGELKGLAAQGLVTPQALVKGLQGVAPEIDKQFATLEPTFADLGAKMGTVFATAYRDSVFEQTVSNFKNFVDSSLTSIDRFFGGENQTVEQLKEQIISAQNEVERLTKLQAKNGLDYGMSIRRNIELIEELEERLKALQEAQGISAPILELTVTGGTEDPQIERNRIFLERLNEFNEMKTETLEEQFLKEAELQKAALDARLITEEQFLQQQAELTKQYSNTKKKEADFEKRIDMERIANQRKYIGAAQILANAFFEDNKAINAGLVVADTAAAITHSLKINPYDYANVAIIAATGAAQLANIFSASKGGGSVDSGSASAGGTSTPTPDFEPDTITQDVNVTEIGDTIATRQQEVVFVADGGSPAEQFLAESMNEAQRRGSIEVRG